ncbi:TPA_asm: P [Populus betacytorhabdovirus 1]|nr:TPA_asm: P [Populus betacytorhabdovirus 1]
MEGIKKNDSADQRKINELKGITLSDSQSYISTALSELEDAQIDPAQLNFQVPDNIKDHIDEKRKEATEALRSTLDSIIQDAGSSKSAIPAAEVSPTAEEILKKVDSTSWSSFNSPVRDEEKGASSPEKAQQQPEKSNPPETPEKSKKDQLAVSVPKNPYTIPSLKDSRPREAPPATSKNGTASTVARERPETNKGSSKEEKKSVTKPSSHKGGDNRSSKKHDTSTARSSSQQAGGRKHKNSGGSYQRQRSKITRSNEELYEDQYDDDDDDYSFEDDDNTVTEEYINDPDELSEIINQSFSDAKIFPSEDHTDHIFYLHNMEGMTARDVYFYTMGVSKERSISFMKKTQDMMSKLEGLLSLANKNMNSSLTNLKISENNLTTLLQVKKEASKTSNKQTEEVGGGGEDPNETDVPKPSSMADRGKGIYTTTTQQPRRATLQERQTLRIPGVEEPALAPSIKKESKVVPEQESYILNPVPSTSGYKKKDVGAPKGVQNEDQEVAQKIALLHDMNFPEKLIANEKVLDMILPMMTPKLIKLYKEGDQQYRATVSSVLLSNLKKQLAKPISTNQ